MRFSEIQRREVVDLETAEVIGHVDDAILDANARLLMGFTLRKTRGNADWLAWVDIKAIGADAITVASVGALMEQPEGKGRLLLGDDVIGGRILNDRGETSSPLADIAFDVPTGQITELILSDSTEIPGSDLLGSGTFATIVKTALATQAIGE
jgi:sporulation protein YlmC with PRC-barrel domain